nr:copia protein [Tanacetum cinerariifolium]
TPVVQKSRIQCYNCKEYGHVAREFQKPKWPKDATYHKEKMLLCKQEEAGFQLNAEQADWKDDTDDEPKDQKLEAHYMYMTQIQEVTPDAVDNSGPIFDTEPLQNKDSEIVKAKVERKFLALKAKKESSDEECLTFESKDKEYAMAVRDFKKFFKRRECPKPPKDKNQRAFAGGSWSDSGEEDDEKVNNETCLVAQASSEICLGVELEPDEWIKDSGCCKHMTGTKWVFRNKLDKNGVVSRNKARLVAQGYNQQEGIDYDETYAPVARLESIRILLAYAYALIFKLFQMGVKSAFLNGFINEEVYVAQPPRFIDFKKPDHVN